MKKIRLIVSDNKKWANVEDIRAALNDDDMIFHAAAILKASIEKGDTGIEAIRKAMAYFFTQGTGLLAHLEN